MTTLISNPARRRRPAFAAALTTVLATALTFSLVTPAAAAPPPVGQGRFDVLVFSKTAGFRHGSIPAGIAAIESLGDQHNFSVTATEDSTAFTTAGLAPYEAVVFLSTTGDVLNDAQQTAFEAYIRGGGGYAGVHAAADTEYSWAFYGSLVGAYFQSHPANQTATVLVEDPAHPSTAALPTQWSRFDEWYNFRANPRANVHVLASVDERTYSPGSGAMGSDHPIAWCQNVDAGRSWYTGMGHTNESFADAAFRGHLLGGIESAAGAAGADCAATRTASFDKVALDENTSNPMELDVAADGRVFYIERNGEVRVVETSGVVRTLVDLDVYTGQESGLLGIALDPAFATNRHVFLYYSPNPASANVDRLSRFTVDAAGTAIALSSEVVVLNVPVQRTTCCHAGGALEFDTQGNLYLATGDNTNPFESQGYTPVDERAGRSAYDAQRTSANTNNLSGKLLRIRPQANGTYTIPAGNMFPVGTAQTRPEIYAMGFRNPFRIGLDPATDNLMVADYGPDAGGGDAARGPDGRVEWSVISQPGNHGWPYCHAANAAYIDWNFATGTGSGAYNCGSPVNTSPNNTGRTTLPASVPAQIWYGKQSSTAWPVFGTGGAPMAGPVYRYDAGLDSTRKWPEYFDGKTLLGEWGKGQFYAVQLDDAGAAPLKAATFLPDDYIKKPMAWEYGPDGALYVIDWGSGFGGNNADSGVYRIDYLSQGRAPIAKAGANKTSGPVPLAVTFNSAGSSDPEGTTLTYAWDLDGDGDTDSTAANPTFTYTAAGSYQALLRVTDGDGFQSTATVNITAGNTVPTVTVTGPPEGGFAEFGDTINYSVAVSDPEDGASGGISCTNVVLKPALGHDDHGHPGEQYRGCSGQFTATLDDSHGPEADVFIVVEADYTDRGGPGGAPPLTGTDLITLQPKTKQAEYFEETGRVPGNTGGGNPGVQRETTGDTAGGFQNLGFIEDGDYWAYSPVNLTGITGISARVASATSGGLMEARWNSPTGPLLATLSVPGTTGWQSYVDVRADLTSVPTGTGTLYFVAQHRTGGTGSLFNVNNYRFEGVGVTADPTVPPPGRRSDTFDGTALDADRWDVVRPDGTLRVTGGELIIPTSATDLYAASATATPNLVLQDLPAGAFEVTTVLTLPARTAWQQAGLLIRGDDDNYVKLVFGNRSSTSSTAARNVELLKETAGSPAGQLSPQLGSAFPDRVHLRLSSTDGVQLTGSYSSDGQTWTPMPAASSLTGIVNPRVGLVALAGNGPRTVIDARFDSFTITPDNPVTPPVNPLNDEFDGTSLAAKWQVVRPEPSALAVAGGELTLTTANGDIFAAQAGQPTNFVLQDAPDGDWTVETIVDTSAFSERFQQAGLIAYVDDGLYLKLDHLTTNAPGAAITSAVELRHEVANVVQEPKPTTAAVPTGRVWLRLQKSGTTFTGAYSTNGTTWTSVAGTGTLSATNATLAASPALRIGVFTLGAGQTARKPASFEHFRAVDGLLTP